MALNLLKAGYPVSVWARRAEFGVSAEAYPTAEAVDVALAAPESTVFLSDSGDNPGAGGTTDVTIKADVAGVLTDVLGFEIAPTGPASAAVEGDMDLRGILGLGIGSHLNRVVASWNQALGQFRPGLR